MCSSDLRETAEYFEQVVAILGTEAAKMAANWIMGELAAGLNRDNLDIVRSPVGAAQLAGLIRRIRDNTLSGKLAKEVFDALWAAEGAGAGEAAVDAIIEKRGLRQISDSGEIEKIVDQVLAANAKSVAEFRAGKEKAFNALVGQVMKATRGKANPGQVNDILRRKLS